MLITLEKIKQDGIESLDEFSIRRNEHEDGRIILNYNQLNSPKTNPIVMECRSLTINRYNYELIARSFERFYNYSECLSITNKFNWDSPITSHDKIDGSLIKVFFYGGSWRVQTRNSFATDYVNGSSYTWANLVLDQLSASNFFHYEDGFRDTCFIFELCSPYNIVVHQHKEVSLHLLAAFVGEVEIDTFTVDELADLMGLLRPTRYTFFSLDEVSSYIKKEANKCETFEGVVLQDINGMRLKLKSEKYVALHKMFSNGNILLDKNIIPLIIEGELDEAAVYFPILKERGAILKEKINQHMKEVDNYWFCFKDVESKKKFALSINDCKWKSLLFLAYTKGGNPADYLTADFVEKFL